MSADAGVEPRTVATLALAVRPSNHSARSHTQSANNNVSLLPKWYKIYSALTEWSTSNSSVDCSHGPAVHRHAVLAVARAARG